MAFAKVRLLPSIPRVKKKEKVGEAVIKSSHDCFNLLAEGENCQVSSIGLDNCDQTTRIKVEGKVR